MQIDFRIDWGYQYLYSRRHYHPWYYWDGELTCNAGEILDTWQLSYPVIWYGPGHCAKETRLASPRWQSKTRRGLSGIRILAEISEKSTFQLHTLSGDFSFPASEILSSGRIIFPVGPKYLGCHVIVTRSRHYWFRPSPRPEQQVWEADELPLPGHDWARMRTAWLAPGETLTLPIDVPTAKKEFQENILHLVAMAAPEYTPDAEQQIHDTFPMTLYCDGKKSAEFAHYFREHDTYMQMLEDVWIRFAAQPGHHSIGLQNNNEHFYLLLSRVVLQQANYEHLEMSLPAWALVNEPLLGRIFALRQDSVDVRWPGGKSSLTVQPGWNEFPFTLTTAGCQIQVSAGQNTAYLPAVYDLREENPPVAVGYDMTVVPHDNHGFMDWLLDYTWRTRLGNFVVFRSFLRKSPYSRDYLAPAPESLARWGEFCRCHHLFVEAATDFDDGVLVKAAGDMLHSVGRHEWPGAVYAFDPKANWGSQDMKEASEHFLTYLRIEVERAHKAAPRAAFGDASGGHRYCYLAGADFLRTETMVPHTQHLCSQARAAAESLGSGEWGVHIAIQHSMQPYYENHLGLYFLSLFQPWMMGASVIYEEDSLFQLFKEERQSWDDALTKGKRDMTREFFRFVKTHPRRGKCQRRIAFLEGRYAAPFNGFICDAEQTPEYSVWGLFGNDSPTWGHGQPEKCRQLLDVLMPGASTLPLRQRFDRRRFYFSGTPYGDFDEVPVEASAEYFQQYQLLLNLGWHSMLAEDYDKLRQFVAQGGTLFTGLPQFSTHVKRDFLADWQDLSLWKDGDLHELCGVQILGPGENYSGQWNAANREDFPEPALSALPNNSPDEDGPCRLAEIVLAGAEVVAWDAASGKPLLVRHRYGRGFVFLLTTWAYPGHERLQQCSASFLTWLAGKHRGSTYVEDASGDIFWTLWQEEYCQRLYLLNTDWTAAGNGKPVRIHTESGSYSLIVNERQACLLTLLPGKALLPSPDAHLEVSENASIYAHGAGQKTLTIYFANGKQEILPLDFSRTTLLNVTLPEYFSGF
ncbi:MAG: hypothetical protein WCT05_08900 [Lentisphaeria bacterium]